MGIFYLYNLYIQISVGVGAFVIGLSQISSFSFKFLVPVGDVKSCILFCNIFFYACDVYLLIARVL